MGGGRVIFSELVAADGGLLNYQDIESGVDAWQLLGNGLSMRGIASRVQWGRAWKTFTIRYRTRNGNPTEWQKRSYAISHDQDGLLYPALTVQAYLDGGELIDAAAVRTVHLYRFAGPIVAREEMLGTFRPPRWRTAGADGNLFLVVTWAELLQANIPMAHVSDDSLFDEGDLGIDL